MDPPDQLLLRLEKKRNQSRSIDSLLSNTGQEPTGPEQIRKWAVEYKEHELYRLFCDNLPKVSAESNLSLKNL